MKIAVAQTKPVKGHIQANIEAHKQLISLALSYGADAIIFPELSVTGYEPGLAKELATDRHDKRFDDFQTISDTGNIIICAGMPLKTDYGIVIGMLIFQPHLPRQVYTKQYLHDDELPYFASGQEQSSLTIKGNDISFAICYELSVPAHAAAAHKNGAQIYIASVAKTVTGIEKAWERLADIARDYSMTVLLSNCIGFCDNFHCGGKSAAWNKKAELIGQLDDSSEGILVVDTDTGVIVPRS